ncbi:MAG: PAS domain S-box protein [Bacteroidota bacterium]
MYQPELQKIIDSFKEQLPESEAFKSFLSEVNSSFKKKTDDRSYDPQLNTEDAILVVENLTDLIALHEPDLTCTYISPACRTILGYEPDELRGMSAYDYFHPDDIHVIGKAHEELLKSPERQVIVPYRLRRKSGEFIWVEATSKVILDDNDKPKKIIAAIRDISRRKEFEQELLQGQIRLQLLNAIMEMRTEAKPADHIINYTLDSLKEFFSDLQISYTTLDERTGIQSVDYMKGFPADIQSMPGRKLDLNYVPQILHTLKRNSPLIINDVLNDERFAVVISEIKKRGVRSVAYFPTKYAPSLIGILSIGSPEVREMSDFEISAFKEISRQLAATLQEARLRTERNTALADLSTRQRELNTLLENTPDVIVRCDKDLRYAYVNKAVERVTGIPLKEFIGKTNEELGLPAVAVYLWNKRARKVFKTAQEESLEFETPTIQGPKIFQVKIIPEFNSSGTIENLLFVGRDITERKIAENSLRQSEERFRAFMDNIPHMAFIKDMDGRYVYVNRALEEMARQFSTDLLFKTDSDWLPEDIAKSYQMIDQQVLQSGEAKESFDLFKKDDIVIHFLTNKFLLKSSKGESFVGGVSVDITKQKEAELQIRHSEEMFRSIFENSATGMWITDMEWNTIETNNTTEALLDYTGEELLLKTLPEIIHPDDRESFLKEYRAIDTDAVRFVQHDRRLLTRSGNIIWVNIITSVVHDNDEKPQFAITMISDITERKMAEEMIRENEARFRAIFETAEIGIVLVSLGGYLLKTNSAFEKIIGYSGEELTLMHIRDFTHPDDIEISLSLFKRLQDNGKDSYSLEKRYICKNGDIIWAKVAVSLVQSIEGKPLYMVGTVEDITTQRMYTEELKMLTEELGNKNRELEIAKQSAERSNSAKSVFLSSMSHELRTPLNAILGFAQVLKNDPSIALRQRGFIETIYRSGNHLLDMINDILDISKIESGRMELFPDDFDLHVMLNDLHDMFNHAARQKGLHLDVSYSADIPQMVYADAKRLRQILINLLGNAVKFTNNGRVSLYAAEKSYIRPDMISLVFSVRDTGRGIPADQLESIFEPFRQTTGMYSEGSGLGLAISRRIAHLMNGTIRVESIPEEGSVFYFEVALQILDHAESQLQASYDPATGALKDNQDTLSGESAQLHAIANAILGLSEELCIALTEAVEVQDILAIETILGSSLVEDTPLKALETAARNSDFKTLTRVAEILFQSRESSL